ncbi:crotonobetainyl-CoA:carnitine CoA-transferase CaiB-like acyl-CoA transferase [Variovorax sp. TBS-050B]|uniref:CaiB/BaiF CoA transferase family protein n=1 Tax=Variovorax sp. TBS-050B TaxID=2940551 RepID=UPI0024765CCA|nr:CoA transferase [Variovorax sp. TBS-050B]MDH6590299.1 crotonobetainyl-CoA:carnitine CoA-transferase CaiB-like acyl-CoA transferase [Variovorax sp. TBS-050B]
MTQATQGLPLQGIRILDMATVLAAPFAATLCGDMGAEVVKLELPRGNDTLRGLAPVHQGHALFWKTANRGKRGISLDVRKPEGREIFLRLVEGFDVLVENFRTGTLDGWGLDLATLHAHNPRLIVLRLTGFGQTGPNARKPGFARIFEAMSGFTHLSGEPGGPPQHMNYPLGDTIAGLFGAFAIATALAERNAQPPDARRGAEIDLSATEALLRLLDPLAAEYRFSGVARERTGSRASYTAPSNVYRTADGAWITLVGSADPIFMRLCAAMEQPALATDPRFDNNLQRTQHHVALDDIVAAWAAHHPLDALAARLAQHEVPFSKVYSIADAMDDPHFRARAAFVELQDPELGAIPAPAAVPRFVGRAAGAAPVVGPRTGQDNAAVYGEIGLGAGDIARLREAGVV